MTDLELLECCQSVIDFLTKSEEEYKMIKSFNTPSGENMDIVLNKYGFERNNDETNMTRFIIFLNKRYGFYEEPLWGTKNTRVDFFKCGAENSKAIILLKSSIRNLKINQLCQKDQK